LFIAMEEGRHGFTLRVVLPPALLTVLVAILLRRRPVPALMLLLLGWSGATLSMPNGTVEFLQMLITDSAVGFIAVIRPRRISIFAAGMTLTVQATTVVYLERGPDFPRDLVFVLVAVIAAWTAGDSTRER